jgi:hypothetical protein
MEDREEYLTAGQVARIIGLSVNTVKKFAKEHVPPEFKFKTPGGHHRYDPAIVPMLEARMELRARRN